MTVPQLPNAIVMHHRESTAADSGSDLDGFELQGATDLDESERGGSIQFRLIVQWRPGESCFKRKRQITLALVTLPTAMNGSSIYNHVLVCITGPSVHPANRAYIVASAAQVNGVFLNCIGRLAAVKQAHQQVTVEDEFTSSFGTLYATASPNMI